MKILHYIDDFKDGDLTSDYVKFLADSMRKTAHVQIVTRNDNMRKMLSETKPDIVHIHACWSYAAARFVSRVHKMNVAVVISPHWGLETYTMRNEKHAEKVMKRMAYQREMAAKADAMVVTSKSEMESIKALGWTKNICLIPSCTLNSDITAEQMGVEMLQLYNKILDTRYFQFMSSQEKEAIRSLLHISKTKDVDDIQLCHESMQELNMLNFEQWRRIMLYADDEDIRVLIEEAARTAQVNFPKINTKDIERYPPACPKATGDINETVLPDKYSPKKELIKEETEDDEEALRTICRMLLYIKFHLGQGTLSMHHLADFYEVIRYEDYDEDRLHELLGLLRMRSFFARTLQILTEDFLLTEGFTPMPPKNDRGTQAIRNITLH